MEFCLFLTVVIGTLDLVLTGDLKEGNDISSVLYLLS